MSIKKLKTGDITSIALMVAATAICSWITIPFTIPFTMQTFAVFFSLEHFGGKKGSLVILLYILLGIVGLPVFSGFSGGIGYLLGPTGGYILGFAVSGILFCLFEKLGFENAVLRFASKLLCLAACYCLGTLWFTHVTGTSFVAALGLCVLPFIIPDVIKIVLADKVAERLAVGKTKHNK